jgi:hypothetical protein
MSQRRALAVEAWHLARAARFPVVAFERGVTVALGLRPWRRFLEQAGVAELRAAVAALDRIQHPQRTGPAAGATREGGETHGEHHE